MKEISDSIRSITKMTEDSYFSNQDSHGALLLETTAMLGRGLGNNLDYVQMQAKLAEMQLNKKHMIKARGAVSESSSFGCITPYTN